VKMEIVYSIYLHALSCQVPATNYALFHMERYLLLKLKAAKAGESAEIETTLDFFKCFREHDEKVQRLLCELYMHNFFLEEDKDSHPGPFIRDFQFKAFLSFATSQLKWAKVHNNFRKRGYGIELWVRGEKLLLFVRHKLFMK